MRVLNLSLAVCVTASPLLGFVFPGVGAAQSKPNAVSSVDPKNLDRSINPCEDFYRFANGGWISRNAVPAEYPSWGTPQILRDQNLEQLRTILEAATKARARKGSNEQKIGDYYYSVMDTKTRDAGGLKPLAPWFKRIDEVRDLKSLQSAFAYLAIYNVDSPFGVGSMPDFKNSKLVIAVAGQSGVSMPDRDYYLKDDEKSKMIREDYVKHLTKTFELMGEDSQKAADDAKTVMKIETRLAGAQLTRIELRNPNSSYHVMTAEERKSLMPNFDWDTYLQDVGFKGITTMNVAQPKFFSEVNAMLAEVPVENWKTYLRWRLVNFMASTLSTPFEEQNFAFYGRVLAGTKEMQPLWKRAVNATSSRLGEAVGEIYVAKYFPPESKQRISRLVANLKAALRTDIGALDWMSDATRKQALGKLDAVAEKIGYPDKWRDYSKLEVNRGAFALNMLRTQQWALQRAVNRVNQPVDRTEWEIPPQTVNAGYNPLGNEIIFPAAILQPPLFDPAADDAVNYGAIGAIIGHELTHGFDDQGAQFDAEGNLKRWWTPEDYGKFQARTKCVEDQFDAYTLEDGTHLKGKLVKGEAIADLGGLKIAWLAYQKSLEGKQRPADIEGFTGEQRFFLGFGQAWKATHRPEFELLQTNTDPHPLPRFRLNGTVANLPEFFKSFGCADTDKMVRTKERCAIW